MIVIKNAHIHTMDSAGDFVGALAIQDGLIAGVDIDLEDPLYKDAHIIDAKGMVLTPGLVDPHCHIGVMEEGIQFEGMDHNEITNPVYPELRAIDALYPHDISFKYAAKSGVTSVVSGPGSANVIGGTFTAIKTVGNTVDAMVIKPEVCMKMALGENPKRTYSKQQKSPSTRMASAALIREWLMRAKEYKEALDRYEANQTDARKPAFDMKLHSLKRVFEGMPVKIHAHRSDDIMTAIRITKEFNLEATIDHGTESHLLVETVKQSEVPLILGPTLGASTKYETVNRTFETAAVLEKHSIPFAIMTDHPVVTLDNTLVQAALYVKAGLSRQRALEALTIDAARLNKIDDRVGSLKVGKDADLVLWDGDLFNIMTRTHLVMIDGVIISEAT